MSLGKTKQVEVEVRLCTPAPVTIPVPDLAGESATMQLYDWTRTQSACLPSNLSHEAPSLAAGEHSSCGMHHQPLTLLPNIEGKLGPECSLVGDVTSASEGSFVALAAVCTMFTAREGLQMHGQVTPLFGFSRQRTELRVKAHSNLFPLMIPLFSNGQI